MKLGEIHHACVGVSDLDRSLEFYVGVLGFRVTLEGGFDDPGHARLLRLPAGSSARVATVQPLRTVTGGVELIELQVPGRPAQGPIGPGDLGVWALTFEVFEAELDVAIGRLEEAGIKFWSERIDFEVEDYGHIESVFCSDPDGFPLELLSLPDPEAVRSLRAEKRRTQADRASSGPTR